MSSQQLEASKYQSPRMDLWPWECSCFERVSFSDGSFSCKSSERYRVTQNSRIGATFHLNRLNEAAFFLFLKKGAYNIVGTTIWFLCRIKTGFLLKALWFCSRTKKNTYTYNLFHHVFFFLYITIYGSFRPTAGWSLRFERSSCRFLSYWWGRNCEASTDGTSFQHVTNTAANVACS